MMDRSLKKSRGGRNFFVLTFITLILFTTLFIFLQNKSWTQYGVEIASGNKNLQRALQNLLKSRGYFQELERDVPPLYLITPTWPRPVQIAELTRLGYLLKVSNDWQHSRTSY